MGQRCTEYIMLEWEKIDRELLINICLELKCTYGPIDESLFEGLDFKEEEIIFFDTAPS